MKSADVAIFGDVSRVYTDWPASRPLRVCAPVIGRKQISHLHAFRPPLVIMGACVRMTIKYQKELAGMFELLLFRIFYFHKIDLLTGKGF